MVQSGAHRKECLRILFWLISSALLFTAAPLPAAAQFKAWVMAKLPDTPEGLGVDFSNMHQGGVEVAMRIHI